MYDDITRAWLRWVRSLRGGRTLRRWADDHPALAGWTVEDLGSPRCGERTDAMQAALVRLAQSGDQAAASTLIVQLRPGLTGVAWRAWHRRCAGPRPFASLGDTRDEVLSAFGETLACHRLDRRPARIAANLVLDTHQRLWRAAGRDDRAAAAAVAVSVAAAGRAVRAGAAAGSPDEVAGALDLTTAVAAAVHRLPGTEASRRLSAELAFRAWILDEPSALIARELGLGRKAVDVRLCRLRTLVRASQAGRTADATRALRAARATANRAAAAGSGDRADSGGDRADSGGDRADSGAGGQAVARRSEGSAPASRPVAPSCARRQ
ncbi:MAG: hypothetical protein R2761_07765 [Acidimicrobiales bacterium]